MRFGGNGGAASIGGGTSIGGQPTGEGQSAGGAGTSRLLSSSRTYQWLAIEGLPYRFFTSVPSNFTAQSGYTYLGVLERPGTIGASLSPTSTLISESLPPLRLTDTSGTLTSLFSIYATGDVVTELRGGSQANTDLTISGTTATVGSTTGLAASGTVYIGVECVSYAAKGTNSDGAPALTGLTRGKYPAFGREWGRYHRVDTTRGQYPRLSSRPVGHIGRMVALYEGRYATDGTALPIGQSQCIALGYLTGITHEGNTYELAIQSLPEYLRGGGPVTGARGAVNSQAYKATVSGFSVGGANLRDGTDPRLQVTVYPYGLAAIGVLTYAAYTAPSVFSWNYTGVAADAAAIDGGALSIASTLNSRLQAAYNAGTLAAQMSLSVLGSTGGRYSEVRTTGNVVAGAPSYATLNAAPYSIPYSEMAPTLVFPPGSIIGIALGFLDGTEDTATFIKCDVRADGVSLYGLNSKKTIARDLLALPPRQLSAQGGTATVSLSIPVTQSSGTLATQADASAAGAFLLVDQKYTVFGTLDTQTTGLQPAAYIGGGGAVMTFTATGLVAGGDVSPLPGQATGNGNTGSLIVAQTIVKRDDEKPLLVEQIWIPRGTRNGQTADSAGNRIDAVEFLLRLMLSSGVPAAASSTYDIDAARWGLGLSPDLVDVASFEALRDTPAEARQRRYVFRKPASAMEILEEEGRTLGFHVAVVSGRLTAIRPTLPTTVSQAQSIYSSTYTQTLSATNTPAGARPKSQRSTDAIINQVKVQVDYDAIAEKYGLPAIEVALVGSQSEIGSVNEITVANRGLRRDFLGAVDQWIGALLASVFAMWSREVQIVSRRISGALRSLRPGQNVTLTEQSVPNLYTGAVGLSAVPAMVRSVRFDRVSDTGDVELVLYPPARAAAAASLADSVLVDIRASGGGYNAGTRVLTVCASQCPGSLPTAEVPYAVGDVITVTEVDPTSATAPQTWTDTVAGVSQTNKTVTLTTGLGGFSATTLYRVEPATYSSCTTSQRAVGCFVADADTQLVASTAGVVRVNV